MRQNLTAQLNTLITGLIILIVGLTPLIFTPFTTEFYDTAKLILLMGGTLFLVLLWIISWIIQGKVLFTKTPLDLPLILLLIVVVLSTIFSDSRYVSIFGNFPRLHGSAIAWIAYILFYFVTASHIKTVGQIKVILYTLLASSLLVVLVSVMSYFGLYLPLQFVQIQNFTPAGSTFAASALLILLLPFTMLSFVYARNQMTSMGGLILSVLIFLTVTLIGGNMDTNLSVIFSPIYLALYVAVGLVVFTSRKNAPQKSALLLVSFAAVLILVLLTSYAPFAQKTPLFAKRVSFPREIQLDLGTSWKVSSATLANNPLLGTGPSTFLFNFTNQKPSEFNLSKYWNIRFDTGFNEYFQTLGTLGLLGFLAFVYFTVMVASLAFHGFSRNDNITAKFLAMSSLLGVVLLLVHVSSPLFWITFIIILAMFMSLQRNSSNRVEELSIGIKASKLTDSNLIVGDILPIIIFIPTLLFVIWAFWNLGTAVTADINHRKALNAANTNALETYNDLREAERLNTYIDLYHTDLAQTNFALANSLAASKGPNQASPSGSLTDDDKKTIQTLLTQSINEARFAVALSPRNPANWEILASIYRQISGVAQNALDFSLDAYGHAILQDPKNPVLRLNVGGVYYSVKNYELATRFFTDAANLKPDYANAYYNLSITLRDKGDLQNAVLAGQQVVSLLSTDTSNPDYKTASAYLSDLQAKAATGSAQQAGGITPPAAQENGALQNKNLPQVQVPELNTKPEVSTPEAVKANPQNKVQPKSATPSPTAAPSAQP